MISLVSQSMLFRYSPDCNRLGIGRTIILTSTAADTQIVMNDRQEFVSLFFHRNRSLGTMAGTIAAFYPLFINDAMKRIIDGFADYQLLFILNGKGMNRTTGTGLTAKITIIGTIAFGKVQMRLENPVHSIFFYRRHQDTAGTPVAAKLTGRAMLRKLIIG